MKTSCSCVIWSWRAVAAWLGIMSSAGWTLATDLTWDGTTNNWNASGPYHWIPAQLPVAGDTGTVSSGTVILPQASSQFPGALYVNSGGKVQLDVRNATYSASQGLYLNGGALVADVIQISVALGGTLIAMPGTTSTMQLDGFDLCDGGAVVTGSGTIDKTGAVAWKLPAGGSGFSGVVNAKQGTIWFEGAATFGGTIVLNRGAAFNNYNSGVSWTINGGVHLKGGTIHNTGNNFMDYQGTAFSALANSVINTSYNGLQSSSGHITMSGPFVGGGGLRKLGIQTLTLNGVMTNFTGRLDVFGGTVVLGSSAKLGGGPVWISPHSTVIANAAAGFTTNQVVTIVGPGSGTALMQGILSVKGNVMPMIRGGGLVAIDGSPFDAVTNQAGIGNGDGFLGGTGTSGAFTGTVLGPGIGSTYRLGGGGGTLVMDRSASTAGVLTGVRDVAIGRNGGGANFAGAVTLNDANDFTGAITVNRGSTLTGAAQDSGSGLSPFGGTGGAVALNCGVLGVNNGGNNSARQAVEKGALNVSGACGVDLAGGSASVVELNMSSLNRDATYGGVLRVYASNGKFTLDSPPSGNPKGILPPYCVWMSSSDYAPYFAKYDGVNGVVAYTAEVGFAGAGADDVVATGTYAVPSPQTIHGLHMGYGQNLTGSKITFTGGGVSGPYGGSIANDLDFGTSEAMFIVNASTGQGISGDILGSGGVAKYGKDNTTFSAKARSVTGRVAVYGGTLNVNNSASVSFSQALGANGSDPVVLNGGSLNLVSYQSGTVFTRSVTVAPSGGTLGYPGYGGTVYVDGAISGPGPLTLAFGAGGGSSITLRSTGNTYGGGTLIYGYYGDSSGVSVDAASSLGGGDVALASGEGAFLYLNGHANMAQTSSLSINHSGLVYMTEGGQTYEIAGLTGAGTLTLGPGAGSGTTTLTLSGTNNSEYAGTIRDNNTGSGRLGALTQAGSGTLALWGANTYTGPTVVSNGTLLVNGSIGAGGVTVAPDATLGGGGTIGGAVTFQNNAKLACEFNSSTNDTLQINGDLVFGANTTLRISTVVRQAKPDTSTDFVLIKYTGANPAPCTWGVDYGSTGWAGAKVKLDTANKRVVVRFSGLKGTVLVIR